MKDYGYSYPVNQLLKYGKPHLKSVPDYLESGLSQEHVPELMRMVSDEDLNWADSDSLEIWAPIHAARTLGQLGAVAAIDMLVEQLNEIDDIDNDWISEEYPAIFEMIGGECLPSLRLFLENNANGLFARMCAARSLKEIGNKYSEYRLQCVEILSHELKRFSFNDPALVGFLISYLVDLKALESIDLIRQAYQEECVDYSIIGDIEDTEILLGIRTQRDTPPPEYKWFFEGNKKENNRHISTSKSEKIGRNARCPCGSGKKYKKCCMNK